MPTKPELEKTLKELNKENERLRETIDTLTAQAGGLADDGTAEYVEQLEAAILPFGAFIPHLKAADVQRKTAVDIGIGVERLRVVIGLGEAIHAREAEDGV